MILCCNPHSDHFQFFLSDTTVLQELAQQNNHSAIIDIRTHTFRIGWKWEVACLQAVFQSYIV